MLKIFNTLTKKKELFSPIKKNAVSIYVCGVTTYDYCHIGHARAFIIFDTIIRYLRSQKYNVSFVRNITDIDDKIIKRSIENREPYNKLTERMISAMHQDMKALNLLSPNFEPRATDYICEIIDLIKILQEKGFAYQTKNGDVCFNIGKFKSYGKLSRRTIEDLKSGMRIKSDTTKKSPLDFVLWKSSKPDEPSWSSPWGKGRPGWHIECSAMSTKLLGETFDIHGGGMDLKFPHHENEIAQSEAAFGKSFANLWMHVGLLKIDQTKMSKSLGNFLLIRDVLKDQHPETIRYFMISGHYRSPLNYSEENLEQAHSSLTTLYLSLRNLPKTSETESRYIEKFNAAMNDDFNTPEALSILFEISHEINKTKKTDTKKAATLAQTLKFLGNILGLFFDSTEVFLQGQSSDIKTETIDKLINERILARENRDWSKADEIRNRLKEMNIIIEDGQEGTTWRKV